jgi:membrane-bound ClpP family serine protease
MNWAGLALGFFSFGIIGFGFFWVIRMEYYLGYLWWPFPMLLGIACVVGSLFVPNAGWSALLGIAGASFIWGATELKEQAVRTELGWFPFNHTPRPDPPFVEIIKKIKAPHL